MMTQETNSKNDYTDGAKEGGVTGASGSRENRTPGKPRVGLLLIAVALFAAAIFMLNVSLGTYTRGLASLNYKMVDATVDQVVEHFDPFGISREVMMNYSFNGQSISAPAPVPSGRVLKHGEKTVVFCDANNPKEIVLEQIIDYDVVTVMGAFGFFALSFAVWIGMKTRK